MKTLKWVELKTDNDFCLSQISKPEFIEEDNMDCSNVTGIKFVYTEEKSTISDEDRKHLSYIFGKERMAKAFYETVYSEELYFVGEVVEYPVVEQFIKPEHREEYKDKRFAVSYDENGEIYEVIPYEENMHPVESKEELRKVYRNITGYTLPVSDDVNGKAPYTKK